MIQLTPRAIEKVKEILDRQYKVALEILREKKAVLEEEIFHA